MCVTKKRGRCRGVQADAESPAERDATVWAVTQRVIRMTLSSSSQSLDVTKMTIVTQMPIGFLIERRRQNPTWASWARTLLSTGASLGGVDKG
jgi:hypothetical protein